MNIAWIIICSIISSFVPSTLAASGEESSHSEREIDTIVEELIPDDPVEVEVKGQDFANEFFGRIYENDSNYKGNLKTLIVGLKNQSKLMTLEDVRNSGYLNREELASIYGYVKDLQPGKLSLIRLIDNSLGRSGSDFIIGRYPDALAARPYGTEAFNPGSPALQPFMRWLELLSHIIWVTPSGQAGGPKVNPTNSTQFSYDLESLAGRLSFNHYHDPSVLSLGATIYATSTGVGGSIALSSDQWSHGFWISGLPGWAGIGYSGLFNMQESQVGLDALGAGGFVGGWKNYTQFALSIQGVSDAGDQGSLGAVLTISKNRTASYLHPYKKKFDPLLEAMAQNLEAQKEKIELNLKVTFALRHLYQNIEPNPEKVESLTRLIDEISIKLEETDQKLAEARSETYRLFNKHFIEVVDSKGIGARAEGGAYIEGIGTGFRASADRGEKTVYRFYDNLDRVQDLLTQSRSHVPHILKLGKKYETKNFPDLLRPLEWEVGEEVITTQSRNYSGSIVLGIGQIPGVEAKVGFSESYNATFEVGVRRLPDNKIEVTFKPSTLNEIGAFLSSLAASGFQVSASKTIALAMRQTMIFDFNIPIAREKYLGFFLSGTLPHSFAPATDIIGDRETEAIIEIAKKAQNKLLDDGILLTYLEKIEIPTKKLYAGFLNIPCLPERKWSGFSVETTKGTAKVISTNGQVALSKESELVNNQTTNGFSGRRSYSSYATIKRGFVMKENQRGDTKGQNLPHIMKEDLDANQFTWAFQGLTLQLKVADTKITLNENNEILQEINNLFDTKIPNFPKEYRGKLESREVFLERTIFTKDIREMQQVTGTVVASIASDTGVPLAHLNQIKDRNDNFGATQVAEKIKELIHNHGKRGIAAIHRLAKGSNRNLFIRTSANTYSDSLELAKQTVARFSSAYTDENSETENLLGRRILINSNMSRRKTRYIIRNIVKRIEKIDFAIEQLNRDPYFTHEGDLLEYDRPDYREHRGQMLSEFRAVREQLRHLLDFDDQGMDSHEASLIRHRLKLKDIKQIHKIVEERVEKPDSDEDPSCQEELDQDEDSF